ncbi:MAG: DUF2867 domain-containing protein [Cyclobacteriaceae bacterium]
MRLDPKEHHKHDWQVKDLLSDFEVEDVWQLPVTLSSNHNLELLQEQFSKSTEKMENRGLPGLLFRIRLFVGNLLGWDEKKDQSRLIPGSIRKRYALSEGLTFEQLPEPGDGDFVPVYKLEKESLAEIENATVHAAIHLGVVPEADNNSGVQMTIYVKPKGVFGRLYMLAIKPFRLYIVYPYLLKTIRKQWDAYLNKTETLSFSAGSTSS